VDGIDRALRRAQPHLVDGEGIVATALGIEADGRRRQVVILTDRRLLVVGRRGETPREFDPDGTAGSFDPSGDLLTFVNGDDEIVLRGVDARGARQLLGLLSARRPRAHRAAPGTVRIVG
jgi:hypothetical protein